MSIHEGLNDRQREAVEHRGTPLIVLAGPGTGKTRVITHRLARFLLDDGADPQSVVALTFTVKAAGEMRERLGQLVEAEASRRVFAGTFHSFGRRIVARLGDLIGLPPMLRIIDSAQRRTMLEEAVVACVDAGELPHVRLAEGGVEGVASRAWRWIERLRTGAVFASDARALGARWASLLEDPPAEWDAARIRAERERGARFADAVAVYDRFERACLREGCGTLDDYILQPIRILRGSSGARDLLAPYARRIVVDEFQDVNGAQLALLRELAPPTAGVDLCAVGDDDQAIYGFRGSDTRAFQHFRAIWTDATTIALTVNYRSAPGVVATANRVIAAATERFDPDKRIEPGGPLAEEPRPVEAVHLESDDASDAIVAMILTALSQDPGCRLETIAVIGRSHTTLDRIADALELAGVPVVRSRQASALDDEAVQDLLAWIRVLVEGSSIDAVRLLVRPPFDLARDAAMLLHKRYRRWAAKEADSAEEPPGFVDWLGTLEAPAEEAARFLSLHRSLASGVSLARASDAVMTIVDRAGLAHAELLPKRQRARRIARLADVLRFVRGAAERLPPPGDLAAFWSHYQRLDEKERAFRFDGEAAVDRDEDSAPEGEGVRLLTAHASKGLEFDTVFVPGGGATKGQFGFDESDDEERVPEEVTGEPAPSTLDERRRLFYVAMTRAQRRLVLLAKKSKRPSSALHLFQEVAWRGKSAAEGLSADGLVELIEESTVHERAAAYGLGNPDELARTLRGVSLDRALWSERRRARQAAAAALDAAERTDLTESVLGTVIERLTAAARTLGAMARVESGDSPDELPGWLGMGAAGEAAERVHALRGETVPAEDRSLGGPLAAPLELSYTKIDAYNTCPACYYLRYELGLREPPTPSLALGSAAHTALDRFYREWRDSDSEGGDTPGKDRLLELVREAFAGVRGVEPETAALALRQSIAQLDAAYDAFHDDHAEILMLEEEVRFDYRREGAADEPAHTVTAKLDRVDRYDLPDGSAGFRIIDYKTGKAKATLLEPSRKDLQLGLYAMALSAALGIPLEELRGEAAYWLLSTQQQGRLAFESVQFAKIREQIDRAIDGMLAGRFEPAPGCRGICGTFAGPVIPPEARSQP